MRMKAAAVFLSVAGLVLLAGWVAAAAGQGAASTEPAGHLQGGGAAAAGEPVRAGTGVVTETRFSTHLPVVFRNLVPCATAPTLLGPADGSQLDTLLPLFEWDAGQDLLATHLWLEASEDITFARGFYALRTTRPRGRYQWLPSSNFEPATRYYWRAWLMCGEAQGPYSTAWSFTTGSGGTLPPAPDLVAPPDGSSVPMPVTLEWLELPGAVQYKVSWAKAGDTTTWWSWSDDLEYEVTRLDPGTEYEWWVRARNDYGLGPESPRWGFTTAAARGPGQLPEAEESGAQPEEFWFEP